MMMDTMKTVIKVFKKNTKEEAMQFIESRLSTSEDPDILDYLVIEGKELVISVKEVVSRINLDKY